MRNGRISVLKGRRDMLELNQPVNFLINFMAWPEQINTYEYDLLYSHTYTIWPYMSASSKSLHYLEYILILGASKQQ